MAGIRYRGLASPVRKNVTARYTNVINDNMVNSPLFFRVFLLINKNNKITNRIDS